MQITDVIADMLTRIRNAGTAKHESVDIPASNMKLAIANILLEEGYIKEVQKIDDGRQGVIRLFLPAGFLHTGNLAFVSQFTETNTANTVMSEIRMRTTADLASVVSSCGELGRSLLLKFH